MILRYVGAIQIIRDTLGGGGSETVSPNDTWGRVWVWQKKHYFYAEFHKKKTVNLQSLNLRYIFKDKKLLSTEICGTDRYTTLLTEVRNRR